MAPSASTLRFMITLGQAAGRQNSTNSASMRYGWFLTAAWSGGDGRDDVGADRPGASGRAAAGPRDQFGLEDEPAVLVLVRPVGLVEQELGGGPAELVLGLAHRGERHGGVGRELDVVVADHGEVRGYRHPGLAQPP